MILIFILIVIIIIILTIKFAGAETINILTSADYDWIVKHFPAHYHLGRNTDIYGFSLGEDFLLYEHNKIKHFSPFFSAKYKPLTKQAITLLKYYYKKIIKANSFQEINFVIYVNEETHIVKLDPNIFEKKYVKPIYKFRKLYQFTFTNNKSLTYADLQKIKTSKPKELINFMPINFYPDYTEKYPYTTYEYYSILNNTIKFKPKFILFNSTNINLLCAISLICTNTIFIINTENQDRLKNTLGLIGTFYKPYDLYIYDTHNSNISLPYCKYTLKAGGKPILIKNNYSYKLHPQIIDIKDINKYTYMIIKKIQGSKVWIEPHTYITNKNIIFPYSII